MSIICASMDRSPDSFNGGRETSPNEQEVFIATPEEEVYVPQFAVTEEALRFYGIEVRERTAENPNIEGTLDDIEIKNKIYTTAVQELKTGNTHFLEFVLSEKLLSKDELQKYGISTLKETAYKILEHMHGQQRAKDIETFRDSGLFTEDEALDARYATY
jgi:hypothetical protein